ncbi:hypothetical protein A3D77_04950 [Candidatus Gottesmanbacteria bacterium RIFCSPHIGHO2_02_FULL_39_11]|uniref:Uncharacterized protein n=1 Tax=Candidatus Gottesmanbacteria bacterium RIFCSPHIGHO2_02_FULL_39_11 TaxID=1798382 RepID=A0A1F5ZLP4_9BACT|nr:MAG: hypothetical protein A3D77_04950 [Candidatus Gottesmanbacteria bacterium RIFCSPHIGHO2_02_FULL_39_11]
MTIRISESDLGRRLLPGRYNEGGWSGWPDGGGYLDGIASDQDHFKGAQFPFVFTSGQYPEQPECIMFKIKNLAENVVVCDFSKERREQLAGKYGGKPDDYAAKWYDHTNDTSGFIKLGENAKVQGIIVESIR